jgi:hypothetical protein
MRITRRHAVRSLLVAACLLAMGAGAAGQSMEDQLRLLGIEALARDYLRPGADAVGYSINSGLFHSAFVDTGLSLYIGLKGIWTLVPPADRSFTAMLPASMTSLGYPASVGTATIFGGDGAVLHSSQTDPGGAPLPDVALPDGVGLDQVFLFVPQATIGSLASTEIFLRGLPPVSYDAGVGDVSFYGIGLKHSPTGYIRLPVDLAVMLAAQRFAIGDAVTATSYNAALIGSVPLGILEAYGGVGYEAYMLDVSYTYTPPAGAALPDPLKQSQHVALDFRRRNLRFTVGVHITVLPLVDLDADYSFGIQDNVTIGAGFKL